MPDVSGLYPQPPQQQPQGSSLLSNPGQAVGIMQGLQDLQIKNAQAPALMQQPAAALSGQNISNQQAQQALRRQQYNEVANWVVNAMPANGTANDFHTAISNAATVFPEAFATNPNLSTTLYGMAFGGGHKPTGLNNIRASTLSPAEGAARTEGPIQRGGVGTSTNIAAATKNGGTFPISQAVGEEVTQKGSAAAAQQLENTATTSPQYHANLENLKQDSQVLGNLGGPSLEVERKLNALTTRLGGFGVTMTPDQLKAADSFSKITNQISINQASGSLAGTDAGRNMTYHANPNLEATPQGREGVIDMLQGNQDAIDKTRDLWFQAKRNGAPASSHYDFIQQIGNAPLNSKTGAKFDPRVFQFNRMSRDNQQKFLGQIDPADLGQFEANFKEAISRGWVKPLKKPNAAEQK